MDNTQKRYGYTGQGLRVNLTTGQITKEPTFPRFKDEIGGTAIGYRVFWDEVPPKTPGRTYIIFNKTSLTH